MAILMCKDTPVYDIDNNRVLSSALTPVINMTKSSYSKWREGRHYVKSNRVAEGSVRKADGLNKRINKRRLSLSDCYWVKYSADNCVDFNSITPYNPDNSFINSAWSGNIHSSSVPDGTLGGSLPKTWDRVRGVLGFHKGSVESQVYYEMAALALAHKLKLPVCRAFTKVSLPQGRTKDGQRLFTQEWVSTEQFKPSMHGVAGTIFIENITNINWMLMTADTLGANNFRKTNMGHNLTLMVALYRKLFDVTTAFQYVIKALLFDVIVNNYDRASNIFNWGYLKSADTGEVVTAPLYDFNLARKTPRLSDVNSIIKQIKKVQQYRTAAISYLKAWVPAIKEFGITEWSDTADYLLKQLTSS